MTAKVKTLKNQDGVVPAIRAREAFKASALSGSYVSDVNRRDFGSLPAEYVDQLREAIEKCGPVYVVWSYATPIGWCDDMGNVTLPPVRYSVTTSNHQRHAAQGLDGSFGIRTTARAVPVGTYGSRAGW